MHSKRFSPVYQYPIRDKHDLRRDQLYKIVYEFGLTVGCIVRGIAPNCPSLPSHYHLKCIWLVTV